MKQMSEGTKGFLLGLILGLMLVVLTIATLADAREPMITVSSMAIGGGTDLQRWGAMNSPGPWPDFLDPDSDIWHTPDGRISRRHAWFNTDHWEYGVEVYTHGSDSMAAMERKRVIEIFLPSPLNRIYYWWNY